VPVLEWLQSVTAAWSAEQKALMLERAGWKGNVVVAKWLIAQGAEWPSAFVGLNTYVISGMTVQQCWSLSAVQWAVASG
jgi:hypothetical protein